MYHINMIKSYFESGKTDTILVFHTCESDENKEAVVELSNSEVPANFEAKFRVTPIESKIQYFIIYQASTNIKILQIILGHSGLLPRVL